jgi:uncharacterized membrane protein YcfT
MSGQNASRLSWVDTAKGISIILVVMMYSVFNVGQDAEGVGLFHYVIGFATPFRMPEFFLISGLFLDQVLARTWRGYADRRVVHYIYFYAVWAVIHIVLKIGVMSASPAEAAVDLLRLAGLRPAAVGGAILDDDGELATGAALDAIAARLGVGVLPVAAVVAHRTGARSAPVVALAA